MKISKLQDYGLLLMIKLAQEWHRRLVPLAEVALIYHLSPLFLKRIASRLKKARLIKSKEGAGGGYRLSRHPKTISVAQIVSCFAGPQILSLSCFSGTCPVKKCTPKIVWQKINQEIFKSLDKITLAQVIR